MEDREIVRVLAVTRLVLGGALLVAPSTMLRAVLGADAAKSPAAKWLGRTLGGRDMLLGGGTFTAYREEQQVGRWCRYGMVADFLDGVSVLFAYRLLRRRRRFLALVAAAGSTAAGAYLSSRMPD